MIDSTNPRILADNIRALTDKTEGLSDAQAAQAAELAALGLYSSDEIDTGMKFGDSNIFRKIFSLEGLPNATTDTLPHGISNIDKVINLYGVAQRTSTYQGRMFPYSNLLLLQYDLNNIYISSSVDRSDVSAIVIIEYTKSAAPSPDLAPAPDDTRSIEPEIREEAPEEERIEAEPIEEPVVEVKKTTRKKTTTE